MRAKAIIIGAGIGGLCTAIALRQIGCEVAVYEQAAEPRAAGAGLTLWPNALRALRHLDLDTAVRAQALELQGAIRRWDGTMLSLLDRERIRRRYGCTAVAVHRLDLMHVLLENAGDVVHYDRRFVRYQQDGHALQAEFADGSRAGADLLIGADGIHSLVRHQMHPAAQPVYRGYPAWRAVTTFAHEEVASFWGESWGRGARFGLVPLTEGRVYWFATANRPAGQPPGDHKAALRALFGNWHRPIPAVIAATPDQAILYNDIADIEPLHSWIDGRVLLLGDAAHAMTPNMGQGACQAIEDAVALQVALQPAADVDAALRQYQQRRLEHTSNVILRSRTIGRMGQLGNPLLIGLRDTTMRLTPASAALRQLDAVMTRLGGGTRAA